MTTLYKLVVPGKGGRSCFWCPRHRSALLQRKNVSDIETQATTLSRTTSLYNMIRRSQSWDKAAGARSKRPKHRIRGWGRAKVTGSTQAEEGQVVSGVLILDPSPLHGLPYDVVHHLNGAPLPENHLLHGATVRNPCSCQTPLKLT